MLTSVDPAVVNTNEYKFNNLESLLRGEIFKTDL